MSQNKTDLDYNTNNTSIRLPFNNLFLNAGFLNGNNKVIVYISTFLITLFAYFSYQIIITIPILYWAQKKGFDITDTSILIKILSEPSIIGISRNLMLVFLLGMFVFTFIMFYLAVTRIHQKPFITIITAYPRIRWKQVFFASGTWAFIFIIMFLIDYVWISPDNYILNFNFQKFTILLIISLLFLPIQSAFEEIFFRGYLMQGLALIFKDGRPPLIITSLLFGLAHIDNPETKQFGVSIMLPYYSLFGLFLGLLALWNNGLELAIGIHAANNIVSSLLITSQNTVLPTDAVFIAKSQNPVIDFLLWISGAVFVLVLFQYKYRFKNHLGLLK